MLGWSLWFHPSLTPQKRSLSLTYLSHQHPSPHSFLMPPSEIFYLSLHLRMSGFPQSMTLFRYVLPVYEWPGSKVTQEQAQGVEIGSLGQRHGSSAQGCKVMSKPPFSLWVVGRTKWNDACETLCELESLPHNPSSVRIESRITVPHVASSTLGEMELWTGKSGHPSKVCCEQNHLSAESGLQAGQARWLTFVWGFTAYKAHRHLLSGCFATTL